MNAEQTLLQRKKKTVRLSKEEILLILRGYQSHPTRWTDVLDDIRQNLDRLPGPARQLYETASIKKLSDRMSTKLAKLMSARNIDDADISQEVERKRGNERRLLFDHGNAGAVRPRAGNPGNLGPAPQTAVANPGPAPGLPLPTLVQHAGLPLPTLVQRPSLPLPTPGPAPRPAVANPGPAPRPIVANPDPAPRPADQQPQPADRRNAIAEALGGR